MVVGSSIYNTGNSCCRILLQSNLSSSGALAYVKCITLLDKIMQYYKAIRRSKALCYDPLMLGWVGVSMLQQEFPVLYKISIW